MMRAIKAAWLAFLSLVAIVIAIDLHRIAGSLETVTGPTLFRVRETREQRDERLRRYTEEAFKDWDAIMKTPDPTRKPSRPK